MKKLTSLILFLVLSLIFTSEVHAKTEKYFLHELGIDSKGVYVKPINKIQKSINKVLPKYKWDVHLSTRGRETKGEKGSGVLASVTFWGTPPNKTKDKSIIHSISISFYEVGNIYCISAELKPNKKKTDYLYATKRVKAIFKEIIKKDLPTKITETLNDLDNPNASINNGGRVDVKTEGTDFMFFYANNDTYNKNHNLLAYVKDYVVNKKPKNNRIRNFTPFRDATLEKLKFYDSIKDTKIPKLDDFSFSLSNKTSANLKDKIYFDIVNYEYETPGKGNNPDLIVHITQIGEKVKIEVNKYSGFMSSKDLYSIIGKFVNIQNPLERYGNYEYYVEDGIHCFEK